uniref:Uncharacterized protein n=1 Tax=Pyrodinium bahamense TaxID=73915 RepID=A0A7S0AQL5_9DINO
MLTFELWTNIAMVATGIGALISGVFGMNLNNYGFDARPGMFYAVSVAIVALMLAFVVVSQYVVARSHRHYNDNAHRFGNNRFFRRIGDNEYVLALSASLPTDSTPMLNMLTRELSERTAPHQEGLPAACFRRQGRMQSTGLGPPASERA